MYLLGVSIKFKYMDMYASHVSKYVNDGSHSYTEIGLIYPLPE